MFTFAIRTMGRSVAERVDRKITLAAAISSALFASVALSPFWMRGTTLLVGIVFVVCAASSLLKLSRPVTSDEG